MVSSKDLNSGRPSRWPRRLAFALLVTAACVTLLLSLGWLLSSSPAAEATPALWSLAALSSDDVWAVGTLSSTGNGYTTITLHWDGNNWTQLPSPSPDNYYNFLYGVSAFSPTDIWAVGSRYNLTLIEHWDGT